MAGCSVTATRLVEMFIILVLVCVICLLSFNMLISDNKLTGLTGTQTSSTTNDQPEYRIMDPATNHPKSHVELPGENQQYKVERQRTRVYKSHPGCEAEVTLRNFPVAEIKEFSTLGDWPAFQTAYKNPCWFYKTNDANGIRCLPYFYELGIAKSGTTSLYNQIVKHLDVVPPNHKEGHFSENTFLKYVDDFSTASEQIFRHEDDQGFHRKITFDANPTFFTSIKYNIPENSKRMEGPTCTSAHVLYAINPRTRFIVIMRNPTDRLFAHHHHMYPPQTRDQMISSKYFHEHVVTAIDDLNNCVGNKSLRACVFDTALRNRLDQAKIPLVSSIYYPFAKEWLSVFPRDQVLFLKAEEFYQDAVAVVRQVYDFLGLSPPRQGILDSIGDEMGRWYQREMEATKDNSTYRSKLLPETRDIVDEFYAPYNQQMSELLGSEKWIFKRE